MPVILRQENATSDWKKLLFVFLGLLGMCGVLFFLTTQSLQVIPSEGGVLVDFRTFGFYTPNVKQITVTEASTSNVVWDVHAPYRHLALDTVSLIAGANPSVPAGSANAVVLVPDSGGNFVLHSGTRYRISVKSTLSRNKCQASTEFTMPDAQGRHGTIPNADGQ